MSEQIIKGLIDANLRTDGFNPHAKFNEINYLLKYKDKDIELTLFCETDKQVVIEVFYQMILKIEEENEGC